MPRLPRFKRSPEIPAFQLTDRDREILHHVHRHRFLRSDHMTTLTAGSTQQVLRRLQRLYHHGYLERPRCQIDYYHRGGSRSMAYGFGNKGFALMKRELSLPYQLDWRKKNRVSRLFLEHALLVSDVMVAIEMACRNQLGIRLIVPEREKFRWSVHIGNRIKSGVVPDRVFGLEFTDTSGRKQTSWYLLEADRGTMPVTRGDLNQSSFQRKLLAYEATWTQNIHKTKFGWNRFRVLTVTSNPDRIATMQQAAHSLAHGHGLFLFLNAKQLSEEKDFFAVHWQTYRDGAVARLLD